MSPIGETDISMEKNSNASIMTNQIILKVAVCDIMINGSGLCIAAAKSDSGLQCNEESADRDDQHIHERHFSDFHLLGSPSIKDKKRSDVMYSWIRTPLSKSDLSNFRRALSYVMKSLWTRPGHSLSHGSQNFACFASFQRWMVLSTLSTMIYTKKCASLSGVKKIINPTPSSARVRAWWWLKPLLNLVHDSQHNGGPEPPFVTDLKADRKIVEQDI